MSNFAVNAMIQSLPKNYFEQGLTNQEKRAIARKAFFPEHTNSAPANSVPAKQTLAQMMAELDSNNNNNNIPFKPNYSKILEPLSKATNNLTKNAKRNANRVARYGPKFRQPRVVNTSYKGPNGPNNIFPEFPNNRAYNSNFTVASNPRHLNNFTGINETPVVEPKYIRVGPRTERNPKWRNTMSRKRKTRKSRR